MKKAMTKLKASLTNNIGLKIIAVAVAAIVWLAVVNISDPEKTVVIYNVPVTVTNEESITDLGMVYSVESGKTVDITISGKRSIVSNLTVDDFKATASLKELSKVNSVPIDITTMNKSIGRKITIVKQSIQSMIVAVEDMDKQKFNIEVEFTGKAADGYIAGNYSLSDSTVDVKAPVSVLDRIARVVAVCDISGKKADFSQNAKITLYDKRGEEIKSKDLTLSRKKVGVSVNILQEKEVPIVFEPVNKAADGYEISDISLSSDTVKLSGAEDLLAEIEKIDITSDMDVSNITKNTTINIDLTEKIPQGVQINDDGKIEVTVKVYKLVTKTLKIKTADLDVDNLKAGLEITFPSEHVEITLRGEKNIIDDISKDTLKASIDLKGAEKGTVTVPVSVKIPDGAELLDEITVKVKLK